MAVPLSFHGGFWMFRVICFFFSSYLKFNPVCRMGVLPVLIVGTGVDDSWCRELMGLFCALFFGALALLWPLRTALWNID